MPDTSPSGHDHYVPDQLPLDAITWEACWRRGCDLMCLPRLGGPLHEALAGKVFFSCPRHGCQGPARPYQESRATLTGTNPPLFLPLITSVTAASPTVVEGMLPQFSRAHDVYSLSPAPCPLCTLCEHVIALPNQEGCTRCMSCCVYSRSACRNHLMDLLQGQGWCIRNFKHDDSPYPNYYRCPHRPSIPGGRSCKRCMLCCVTRASACKTHMLELLYAQGWGHFDPFPGRSDIPRQYYYSDLEDDTSSESDAPPESDDSGSSLISLYSPRPSSPDSGVGPAGYAGISCTACCAGGTRAPVERELAFATSASGDGGVGEEGVVENEGSRAAPAPRQWRPPFRSVSPTPLSLPLTRPIYVRVEFANIVFFIRYDLDIWYRPDLFALEQIPVEQRAKIGYDYFANNDVYIYHYAARKWRLRGTDFYMLVPEHLNWVNVALPRVMYKIEEHPLAAPPPVVPAAPAPVVRAAVVVRAATVSRIVRS